MNQKGFSTVAGVILGLVILSAVVVGGVLVLRDKGIEDSGSMAQDETANWKTYKNEKYGFEFKYPPTAELVGVSKPKPEEHKPPLPSDTDITVRGTVTFNGVDRGDFSLRIFEDIEVQGYPTKLNEKSLSGLGAIANKGATVFQGYSATYFNICGETDCERVILVKKDGLNYQLTVELTAFGLSTENQIITKEINKARQKILDTFRFIR